MSFVTKCHDKNSSRVKVYPWILITFLSCRLILNKSTQEERGGGDIWRKMMLRKNDEFRLVSFIACNDRIWTFS